MTITYGSVSSFTSGSRRMISPADASVLILPPSLCFFFLGGRHFNESGFLLSFRHYEAVSVLSPPSSETLTRHNPNIFLPTEHRNALYENERGSPSVATLACVTEMFSNLHISTSIKLRWNPGSGCGFIRGHGSSGKTAPFSAAYLLRWRSSRNHER